MCSQSVKVKKATFVFHNPMKWSTLVATNQDQLIPSIVIQTCLSPARKKMMKRGRKRKQRRKWWRGEEKESKGENGGELGKEAS